MKDSVNKIKSLMRDLINRMDQVKERGEHWGLKTKERDWVTQENDKVEEKPRGISKMDVFRDLLVQEKCLQNPVKTRLHWTGQDVE